MRSTLLAFGMNISEDSLAIEMQTNSDIGTNMSRMQAAAAVRNLSSTVVVNTSLQDVRYALSRGQLVIVLYQAWADEPTVPYINVWDSGHYSVLFGIDDVNIYLMDPWTGAYGFVPTEYFMAARWHAPDDVAPEGICVRCSLLVGASPQVPPPAKILVQRAGAPAGLIFID
jgi:predicted double-glycine peptidase